MAATLTNYIVKLATDPNAQNEFKKDPQGAAKAAGLTQAQVDAVTSKDKNKIQSEVAKEIPAGAGAGPAFGITLSLTLTIGS